VLSSGDLRLDPSSCDVSYQGQSLRVTPKEYSLLELFLRNPSRVFSRGQIIDHLWTFDDPPQEESVKAHIKGLRKRLRTVGIDDWIENVYGIGYRFTPKIEQQQSPKASTNFSDDDSHSISNSIEQEFNEKMNQMWQQYQDLMAQRLDILQKATIAVKKGELSADLHKSAQQAAHKLAGVLGMFEREMGTKIAREIENLLQENEVLSSTQQQEFISLVRDLQDLLVLSEEATNTLTKANPKLLLIDRDRQLTKNLQRLAQLSGMQWQQVNDCVAAREWLQDNSPYVVVLNIDFSKQSKEQLKLIQDLNNQTSPIPTLILAENDALSDRITVARSGASSFLVKPITATEIWNTVTQILERDPSFTANVLVVDDDPVFLAAIRPILEPWGIRMTALENPLNFWEVLQTTNPDLLILDVEMPQISGIELCQAIRTDPKWQSLPVLFLTARRDANTIQQVFAAGADDYITKPIVGPELLTRITNRLERNHLLQNLSRKDSVTGLLNQTQSSREIDDLLKNYQSCCLTFLTLTDLHQVNLKYGHAMGNQVLQRWGRILQAAFRSTEILGYWGNGEFAIAIPNISKTEMSDRLAEILTTLRKQIFTAPNGSRFQVMIKSAIASYPDDGKTQLALYQVLSSK
jgi:diguanylate cyclase (GGDEF)-like protein